MIDKLNIQNADWNCPSVENRTAFTTLTQDRIASFTDVDHVKRIMEDEMRISKKSHYLLPLWQNLESIALGTRILNENRYFTPSEYCVKSLEDIVHVNFDFHSDPLMQAVVKTIPSYKDKPLIVEIEAPFSILAALMNPVDLYSCFEDNRKLLTHILHKIADASAQYIHECVGAGCRVFSLADPVGTLNLTGGEYYASICGESEVYLMKKCIPFLDKAVIHICRKMSQSLVIADLAGTERYKLPVTANSYMDELLQMADNPAIHFTGMTCLHNTCPDFTSPYIIHIE